MNVGRRGDSPDPELERLRRQYPRWQIWRGQATGDYWAVPPRDHPTVHQLINARDTADLADRLDQAHRLDM